MGKFWKIRAEAETNEAELLLYGDIGTVDGWNDVTARQFSQDLAALGDVDVINLRINSVGGDVFAGQAIHSMLKRHKAAINVYVDGLAASIASVVAMAGNTVYMPDNAMMMIHNPWTIAAGNAGELRKTADDMDKIRESMIAAYRVKSGLDDERITEIMDAETWLTAAEAVELGFADEIEAGKLVAASAAGSSLKINGQEFDLSKFTKAPRFAAVENDVCGKGVKGTMDEEQFKASHPDLYEQVRQAAYSAGVMAERGRMKELDALAAPGCEEILAQARYQTGANAQAVAMECFAVLKKTANAANALTGMHEDANILNGISASGSEETNDAEERKKAANAIAAAANRLRGGK